MALFNGTQAIGLDIVKSKGTARRRWPTRVKARIAELQKTLPPGVQFDDRARRGRAREPLGAQRRGGADRGRAAHRARRLPVPELVALDGHHRSRAAGVGARVVRRRCWSFGFTLNTMSLLGLSLAIGILIDDAIVVRENIVRHIEMGEDHMRAAHEGTDEIGLAVTATTFSIVAVFVPVGFMHGDRGPVVQAVRAHDRLRRARVALRVVLARPDALGVLARSAGRGARAPQPDRARARALQPVVRPAGGGYKRLIAWALDHRVR